MKFNSLNNISLLRLTGITKFICIDIHADYIKFTCIKRKEPFYRIHTNNSLDNLHIIGTDFKRGNDLKNIIDSTIKELVSRHSFNDAVIIVGINDFKFTTISVPPDTEDIDLWFSENESKFLPEKRSASDFTFSYELYKEDENNKNFYIVIARNFFIKSVYESCNTTGLRFLGILPFSLSIFSYVVNSGNTLFLSFEEGKIYYFFKSHSGNILFRDVFLDIYEPLLGEEKTPIELKKINSNNLNFFLEELKQTLTLSAGVQSLENLNIFLSAYPNQFEQIASFIKKFFGPDNISSVDNKDGLFYISSLFAVNKLLYDYDTKLNIFKEEGSEKERELLEKQTSFRVAVSTGMVLLFLLFSTYLVENYLISKMSNEEESYIELSSKAGNVEKLKKENSYLRANLALLSKLKGNRVEYSSLLYDVTKIINPGSCLTGFNLKENTPGYIVVEFTGLGRSQQDVAEFISNMEYSKKFKDISLVYSSLLRESRSQLYGSIQGNNYVNFNITAKYYAYQK